MVFEKATITKSFGYNLWKGNNLEANVEGTKIVGQVLQKRIDAIPIDKFYGIHFDNVHLQKAIENILEKPKRYIILFGKKIISFLFIDIKSTLPNYYNPFHYIILFPSFLIHFQRLFCQFASEAVQKDHRL